MIPQLGAKAVYRKAWLYTNGKIIPVEIIKDYVVWVFEQELNLEDRQNQLVKVGNGGVCEEYVVEVKN